MLSFTLITNAVGVWSVDLSKLASLQLGSSIVYFQILHLKSNYKKKEIWLQLDKIFTILNEDY